VRRRSTAVAASMPSSAIRTPFGLLDQRPVLQTACSCSACRPLTPSTTSSTSLRPASPTPPSTDDPHAGDPGPPAPADPHDQGRLALSMSSTVRSTVWDMSAPHSREISSTSHFVAALAIPCSDWPACFAAERNSFGGPSGPVRRSTGRRPRRLRIDGLGREPLGLDQGVPASCSARQNSPYLRGARRFTGRTFTATTSHALLELPRNSPRTSRDLGLHEHRGSLAAPGVAER